MKLRGAIEDAIYGSAYAVRVHQLISAGYPHAWRVADSEAGRPAGAGDRLAEWGQWSTELAIRFANEAIEMHRSVLRGRPKPGEV